MRESRLAPLTGVLCVGLLVVGFVVDPNTDFMPAEVDVVARFTAHPLRVTIGAYLGLLAAASLLWFSGSVYADLRRQADDGERLALLAFGGGVLASALLVLGNVATLAAAERVRIHDIIDPGAAAALFDVSGIALGNGLPIGLGVLIGAAAFGAMRSPQSSRLLAILGLVIAAGLLSPFGWMVLAVGLAWIFIVSITMLRSEPDRILSS